MSMSNFSRCLDVLTVTLMFGRDAGVSTRARRVGDVRRQLVITRHPFNAEKSCV